MGSLETQPISFKNFSGGITDNFLQGTTERYKDADNFLITVDAKLELRNGTTVYDPTAYALNLGSRVAGLFTAIHETVLFGHANRDLYTQSPDSRYGTAWTRIVGPTGNEALGGGSNYSQVTTGEFQRQVYFTSDEGIQPGKLTRGTDNAWKALTAGIPKMNWTPNFPDNSTLIAKCIVLANQLRTSMVSHFNDAANVAASSSTAYQHSMIDKWSLSYFVAQSWSLSDVEYPGPQPVPTAAVNATSEATLYTLCAALALAYEHHRKDLAGVQPDLDTGQRVYHQYIFIYPTGAVANPYQATSGTVPNQLGLAAKAVLSGIVTNPQKAAAFLDELATKWYWHQLLPFSHSPDNTYSLMSRYLLSATGNDFVRIGSIYSSPLTLQVNPNYSDFIAMAYWMKSALNQHGLGTGESANDMHSQIDPYAIITLPNPVDFDSAALTMFWARWLYEKTHMLDAIVGTHTRFGYDSTTGSANITSVTKTSDSTVLTLPVGSWVLMDQDFFNDPQINNRRASRVLASGAGTATLSRTIISGSSGASAQYSTSWMHGAYINGDITVSGADTTTSSVKAAEFIQNPGAIGTDLRTWITLGAEFLTCLGAHEANGDLSPAASSHKQPNFLGNDLTGLAPVNNNPFFVPTVVSLGWAAFYRYQYTVEQNGIFYLNEGPPVFSTSVQTCPSYPVGTILPTYNATYFNASTISAQNACATLKSIPGLLNTSITNYDTNISVAPIPTTAGTSGYDRDFTIELYRTTNGGTTFYYLDSLVNVTATQDYSDYNNESSPIPGTTALNLQKVMYTSGGVAANDPPPTAKFIHQFSGFMYYGAITDSGQYFPQRIRQSIAGEPDSAPATFFDDMDDELTGLSSTRSNLLAFCTNSVFRVSGSFTSTGQGSMTHDRIADAMGCLNAKSIVKTEIGVFYAGTDGFYYTDGYQVIKISLELDKTYRSMTESDSQKARIYGAYDKLTRRVWWAMQSEPTASDNDVFFVFYLDYGVKPSGVFTKALTTDSWKPSSHVFYKGNLIIGDAQGYLFKTDTNTKTDPKISYGTNPSTWRTVYVPWKWTSCGLDMGSTSKRKWVNRIHAVGQNVGNAAIQINSINDAGSMPDGTSSTLPLAPVQYVKNPTWGAPGVVWGDSTYAWKYDGSMDLWRRFPSRSMRSDFKQVQYLPGNFVVYRSDDWPEFSFANVSASGLTATLVTPSGYTSFTWPLDIVDYYISFDTDNYATKYLISTLDVTNIIATFTDPSGTILINATAKWQISGIKKEQRIRITSIDVHFAALGDEFEAYPGASGAGGMGDNA